MSGVWNPSRRRNPQRCRCFSNLSLAETSTNAHTRPDGAQQMATDSGGSSTASRPHQFTSARTSPPINPQVHVHPDRSDLASHGFHYLLHLGPLDAPLIHREEAEKSNTYQRRAHGQQPLGLSDTWSWALSQSGGNQSQAGRCLPGAGAGNTYLPSQSDSEIEYPGQNRTRTRCERSPCQG